MREEAAHGFLEKCVKEVTRAQLAKHCRDLTFSSRDWVPGSAVYGEEMSIILVWGAMASIVLKIHFDFAVARVWASHGISVPLEKVTPEIGRDFMKEFSNLQAGSLRGLFEQDGILLGMSLPFLSHGEDEPVFQKIGDPLARRVAWKVSDGIREAVCTSEIRLLDARPFEGLDKRRDDGLRRGQEASPMRPSGEVEFL